MALRDDLAHSERWTDEAAVVELQAEKDAVSNNWDAETRGVRGEGVQRARSCCSGELDESIVRFEFPACRPLGGNEGQQAVPGRERSRRVRDRHRRGGQGDCGREDLTGGLVSRSVAHDRIAHCHLVVVHGAVCHEAVQVILLTEAVGSEHLESERQPASALSVG